MNAINNIFDSMDKNPALGWSVCVAFVVLCIMCRKRRMASRERPQVGRVARGSLGQVLLRWTPRDAFTVRDLLNGGCVILGRAGSGKTSSSGRTLMQSIVSNRKSGGLILAAKSEDEPDIKRVFRKAGRLRDLIVFGPDTPYRFNFLRYVGRGDPRNVVQCMMMIGETLQRGDSKGSEDSDYWKAQCERLIETAVIALQMAGQEVTALNLHRFISTAAQSPQDLGRESWQKQYHGKVLEAGDNVKKSAAQAHDYQMARDYWLLEYASMADRTRSSIATYATQIIFVFNTGMAKEMIAGDSNVTPDAILNGKWVLVNFPPSAFGAVGSLISAGWKYLTELAILRRKAGEKSPFVVIHCDEAHQFVNSFDAPFIAQCRSHKGCLVFLSQSVASFYAALKGESGRHQADALLANFSHAIIHSCDPMTARWAGMKLGQELKTYYGGNNTHNSGSTMWDNLYGDSQFSSSFSQHMAPVLDESAFMTGRTGGPENGYVADAVVVKSGESFAGGASFLRLTFSQRGS
jgi:hypothetical protein